MENQPNNDASDTQQPGVDPPSNSAQPNMSTPIPPHGEAGHAVSLPGAPRTSKKSKLIAIFAGVFVLVFGGAGFAAYTMMVAPQIKVGNALSNLQELDSVTVDFVVEADELEGADISGSIAPNLSAEQLALRLNLDLQIFAPTLDAQLIDGVFYVRISELDGAEALLAPFLGGFAAGLSGDDRLDEAELQGFSQLSTAFEPLVQQINNQWVEINSSLLEGSGVDVTALIDDVQTRLAGVENLTDGFEIVEMLDNEDVNGVDALHAKIAVQPENLKPLLSQALAGLSVGNQTLEAGDIEEAFDEMFAEYDAATDVFDVWVDPDTEQLIRISLSETNDSGQTTSLRLDMSQHNAVPTLTAPESTISVLELYSLVEDAFGTLPLGDVLGEISL